MKLFKKAYHFLGSIYCAITLIAAVAIFVIAGTLIESHTDSHRFASRFTYGNPVFGLLLWLFFINILFAALRRWPFKYRHIPFLITHFGLLMILGGMLIKSYYGTQGSLSIIEGSASQEIYLPDTYVVMVEKPDSADFNKTVFKHYELPKTVLGNFSSNIKDTSISDSLFQDLEIRLTAYEPNSIERLDTWFKDGNAFISGIKPISVGHWDGSAQILPISSPARLHHSRSHPWDILALHTDLIAEAAKKAYLQGMEMVLTDTSTGKKVYKGPISDLLNDTAAWDGGSASGDLHFNYSPLSGFDSPTLELTFTLDGKKQKEKISIPLDGNNALMNINKHTPYFGRTPISADLHRKPILLLVEDGQEDAYLFAFDPHGQVYHESFRKDNLTSLIVYDRGFGGYATQFKIPFPSYRNGRLDREAANLHYLAIQLRQGMENTDTLAPPLDLLRDACQKENADLVECCLAFLSDWDKGHGWVYPANRQLPEKFSRVLARLDWSKVSAKDKKACELIVKLFSELEPEIRDGCDIMEILQRRKWPLIQALQEICKIGGAEHYQTLLTALTQQVFGAVQQLDLNDIESPLKEDAGNNSMLLSAYLRVYSIHLSTIIQPWNEKEMESRVRLYHASRLFAKRVNDALAPLNNWDMRMQTELIASLPDKAKTLLQIEQAYKILLQQAGRTNTTSAISKNELAKAYTLFAPLPGYREKPILNLEKDLEASPVCLECPVTSRQIASPTQQKLEDNLPKIALTFKENGVSHNITLTYDRFGFGLKWPVLGGKYLVRFQPKYQTIPYRVRLREARQINYANSFQPYSYESDLIVTDNSRQEAQPVEKTISMNNVYETWEGYRFYLASINPPAPEAVKRVQIVVNHDPAKYYLTYPGAVILSLGIILLFWLRPYSKKKGLS